MYSLVIVLVIGFVCFGVGLILGCLLMTQDDIIPEKEKSEKESRSNSQQINEVVGK